MRSCTALVQQHTFTVLCYHHTHTPLTPHPHSTHPHPTHAHSTHHLHTLIPHNLHHTPLLYKPSPTHAHFTHTLHTPQAVRHTTQHHPHTTCPPHLSLVQHFRCVGVPFFGRMSVRVWYKPSTCTFGNASHTTRLTIVYVCSQECPMLRLNSTRNFSSLLSLRTICEGGLPHCVLHTQDTAHQNIPTEQLGILFLTWLQHLYTKSGMEMKTHHMDWLTFCIFKTHARNACK